MAATAVDYAHLAFELIEELDRLATADLVIGRLSATLSRFGFTSFVICGVPEPPERVEPFILFNNWPNGWTDIYLERNYYPDDPIAERCRRSVDPFEWSEVEYDAESNPRAAEVMNGAAEFGMKKGFLVPIIRTDRFHACVTMAGERPDFEPRAKRAIHLMSLYAHAKAATLFGYGQAQPRRSALTEREREVLKWTAIGKSSWEISTILGISERTVNWFAASAVRKLDAANRTHAVVNAIRSREIVI